MAVRHVSRTHRVSLPWLYDVMQSDGNTSIKYANTKQQCAGIFKNGFTNAEMRKVLVPIIAVFDMNRQTSAKLGVHSPCIAMSKTGARVAMEIQKITDAESVRNHMCCHNMLSVSAICSCSLGMSTMITFHRHS